MKYTYENKEIERIVYDTMIEIENDVELESVTKQYIISLCEFGCRKHNSKKSNSPIDRNLVRHILENTNMIDRLLKYNTKQNIIYRTYDYDNNPVKFNILVKTNKSYGYELNDVKEGTLKTIKQYLEKLQ
jgi:hypothetical protein